MRNAALCTLVALALGLTVTATPAQRTTEVTRTTKDTEGNLRVTRTEVTGGEVIRVTVDQDTVDFKDAPPRVINGRVMVPLRGVFERIGGDLRWNPSDRTVIARRGGRDVRLQIGNPVAVVGTDRMALDAPPVVVRGRTYVPLRFVSEALGADVNYDAQSRQVHITTSKTEVTTEEVETVPTPGDVPAEPPVPDQP